MAKFTLTIETDQECFPENRLEQSREQYRLRDVLVLVTSAVINRGLTAGDVTAITGARAEYSYIAKRQKTTAKPAA
jgi:hypothetical protein